jgi:hypothetical protein
MAAPRPGSAAGLGGRRERQHYCRFLILADGRTEHDFGLTIGIMYTKLSELKTPCGPI